MKDNKEIIQVAEGKVFFDSNILVYFIDERDSEKQLKARELIEAATSNQTGIVSTQSLQEVYNVATKKLNCPKNKAKQLIKMFSETLPVTQVTIPLILKAIDISIKTEYSFWDSLILSAAKDSGCIIVYSEDMQNGHIVDGMKILNPFVLA